MIINWQSMYPDSPFLSIAHMNKAFTLFAKENDRRLPSKIIMGPNPYFDLGCIAHTGHDYIEWHEAIERQIFRVIQNGQRIDIPIELVKDDNHFEMI